MSAPIAGYVDLSLCLPVFINNETCKILLLDPPKQFYPLIYVPGLSFATNSPVIETSKALAFRYLHTVFALFPLLNYLFVSRVSDHFLASGGNQPKQSL